MHGHLLKSFFTGPWAIEPSAAQAYFPFLKSIIIDHSPIAFERDKSNHNMFFMNAGMEVSLNSSDGHRTGATEQKYVAVIPIKDVIIKYDEDCGPYGTETIAGWVRSAQDNPSVSAIILDFDTPGGQGNATQLLSALIKESNKPVLAYCGDGMCASAGYWIASNCLEIYATHKTDEIGSIGTYVTLADWIKFYASQGLDIHEIYASKSTEKNKLYRDVIDGKDGAVEAFKKQYIDPFNDQFLATVKDNRPSVSEEALKGKLFYAEDALAAGLIDGFKTFKEVVDRAFELSESNNYQSNNNSKSNAMFGKNKKVSEFAALHAFAAAAEKDRTDDLLKSVNDELQAAGINGFLFESTEELPNASAVSDKLKTQSDEITTLTAQVSELTTENTTLKDKVNGKPAGETTKPIAPKADELNSGTEKPDFTSEADEELAKHKASFK